jgi:hypothetical protein
MNYLTVEVDVVDGKLVCKEPDRLPKTGRGTLTIIVDDSQTETVARTRVKLPIVQGDGTRIINPSSQELDDDGAN